MDERGYTLPRSAFSPREVARAGDVWRLFQDIAVEGSASAGWPPARYRAERVSFVVRSMIVRHHREVVYGEPIVGRTWPSAFRREMFFRRECRAEVQGLPVASATQEWVHVSAEVKLEKASPQLINAFPVEEHEAPIAFPAFAPLETSVRHRFDLEVWQTWMDPLDHVNHPQYIEYADEALARAVRGLGVEPSRLVSIAEEARFKAPALAADKITVETQLIGTLDDAVVVQHRIERRGLLLASIRAVRRLADDDGVILRRLA